MEDQANYQAPGQPAGQPPLSQPPGRPSLLVSDNQIFAHNYLAPCQTFSCRNQAKYFVGRPDGPLQPCHALCPECAAKLVQSIPAELKEEFIPAEGMVMVSAEGLKEYEEFLQAVTDENAALAAKVAELEAKAAKSSAAKKKAKGSEEDGGNTDNGGQNQDSGGQGGAPGGPEQSLDAHDAGGPPTAQGEAL